jgi:hypothetical protein
MADVATPPEQADSAPPLLLYSQGWSTLLAGALLLMISFTTDYADDNLFRCGSFPGPAKVGMLLHFTALAALAANAQLVTHLRHQAAYEAARTERARLREADSRKRNALEAAAREQRQNRALQAGALSSSVQSPSTGDSSPT